MSTQPAAPTAPKKPLEMTITAWKPHVKNTLRGFFSVSVGGMIIHDFMLHEKNESRWVNPPSRPKDAIGTEDRYPPLIEFNEELKKRFDDGALAALDRFFATKETSR